MAKPKTVLVYRHAAVTRLTHWVNVLALTLLLMSGLNIFGAHPALYWGQKSTFAHPWVAIGAEMKGDDMVGLTQIGSAKFNTTGVLGYSGKVGSREPVAFPSWATVPSQRDLADARHWHFFFAWLFVVNGFLYLTYSIASRHLTHDLTPTRLEWRSIGRSILDHLRFKHPTGEASKHYNVLQKVTYLTVIFGLLPFLILMGLAMSPRMDSLFPGWIGLVGGRQSARTLHFVAATLLVLFVLIHVFEVIITGLWNNVRSMITGRYEVEDT